MTPEERRSAARQRAMAVIAEAKAVIAARVPFDHAEWAARAPHDARQMRQWLAEAPETFA